MMPFLAAEFRPFLTVSQKPLNRRWLAPQHIEIALADGQLHDFLRFHHF
jgi:hypothetical protein